MKTPHLPHMVAENDDGIRPAGRPDACFYCRRRVGERHAFDCIMVGIPRTYRVILDGEDVGSWTIEDPISWDARMRAFHKNESAWCKNNMLDESMMGVTEEARKTIQAAMRAGAPGMCILCPRVSLIPCDEPEYEEAAR